MTPAQPGIVIRLSTSNCYLEKRQRFMSDFHSGYRTFGIQFYAVYLSKSKAESWPG
jgi:predicted secreted protein